MQRLRRAAVAALRNRQLDEGERLRRGLLFWTERQLHRAWMVRARRTSHRSRIDLASISYYLAPRIYLAAARTHGAERHCGGGAPQEWRRIASKRSHQWETLGHTAERFLSRRMLRAFNKWAADTQAIRRAARSLQVVHAAAICMRAVPAASGSALVTDGITHAPLRLNEPL